MFITRKTQRQNTIQNSLFMLLFLAVIILLAVLSTRYSYEFDWTANGRNSLSEATTTLLTRIDDPIIITSYATENESVRQSIVRLIKRYQRYKKDISLKFVNPDLEPDTVRELGITINGELVIQYQGRQENLRTLSEQALSNTLQRLVRSGERWLVFLDGHGERKPLGIANHDYGQWGQQLKAKGFKILSHNLAKDPQLPDNTSVLIIAGPQVNLLPREVQTIRQFIVNGGNLLWLTDPEEEAGLSTLAELLHVGFEPGLIVDPTTQVLGVNDPRFAIVTEYPDHGITKNFDTLSLFPQAVGLFIIESETDADKWQATAFLRTQSRSWSETGEISGSIRFDLGADIAGPLTIGLALTRQQINQPEKNQRIIITGDGDFLSNAYLGNGGNLSLGNNMLNWLSHDDDLINIPAKITIDNNLQLSPLAQGIIGIGFLVLIPLLLAGTGMIVWWKRRHL